jgi:hypothetical protein
MKHRITLISSVLLISSLPLSAQSPATIPAPSQLGTAHTAFLASGSAPGAGPREFLIAQMVYASTYKSLSSSGQYRLVGAPADAEMSMVISTNITISDVINGGSLNSAFIRLEIFDVKTHTLLWALDEPIQGAFREKTFQKNVDESIAALMNDLKTLASGVIPGDPTAAPKPEPTKTRLSNEK